MGRFRVWPTDNRLAAAILACYFILATAYNLADPLFEAPDELLHYDFIRFLQRERRLPVVDLSGPLSEYHQPPLYYALAALITAPLPHGQVETHTQPNPFWGYEIGAVGRDNKNQYLHGPAQRFPYDDVAWAVRLTRGLSTLFALATLALTYALARHFVSKPLAAMSMALLAFTPNFLLTSAAVTNDSFVILLSTAIGLALIRLLGAESPPPWRAWLGLGLLLGLGTLAKFSAWPLMPLSALVVVLLALRWRSWRIFVLAGAILLTVVALLAGWWVARNLRLYGSLTGLNIMWAVWGVRHPPTLPEYLVELHNFRTTFWANFGYGNVPLPGWIYALLDIFTLGGVIGLLVALIRRRGTRLDPVLRDRIIFLACWFVMTFGALIWYLQRTFSVTGRQLYAVFPVIALALTVGWSSLLPRVKERILSVVLSLLFFALALGALLGVLIPAYRSSPRLPADRIDEAIPHRLDWRIGKVATLLGYEVSPPVVSPGETVMLTLYWQPIQTPDRNYALFVHLFGRGGALVGARDTYPGLGNDPTLHWTPGEVIADTVPVPLAPDAQGPILLDIEVGLYDLETRKRLDILDPAGNRIGYPVIGTVKLRGTESSRPAAYPLNMAFVGGLVLSGYDLSATQLVPGDTLYLTLYWSPSGPLPTDYTVFVHLLSGSGELVAQADGPPRNGRYPTTAWGAGERFDDLHRLTLPDNLPPGQYTLSLGLYNSQDGLRLPLADGGNQIRLEQVLTLR